MASSQRRRGWGAELVGAMALCALLIACKGGSSDYAEEVAAAEKMAQIYADQDWATARVEFDETMRSALSEEQLSENHALIEDEVGEYVSHGKGKARSQAGHVVVDLPMEFERATLKMRVVYNAAGEVSGWFVLPPAAP